MKRTSKSPQDKKDGKINIEEYSQAAEQKASGGLAGDAPQRGR